MTLAPAAATICSGTSTTITATYSGSAATFNWYNNATNALLFTTPNATSSSFVTPNLTSTTTYRVEAATNDCGTTLQQTATVSTGAPTVAISPNAPTVCTGSSVTLQASSNNPGATYQWYTLTTQGQTTSETAIAGATNAAYIFEAGTTTAAEQLRVRLSTGCGSATADVTVNKVSAASNSVSPSSTICAGTSATLTATSNISNASYAWYTTSRASVLSTSASLSVSPDATTTYNVDVSTGCGTQTLSSTVTVNPAVVVSPASATVVSGNTITLTASGSTTNSYVWTATSGGTTTTLVGQTGASVTVTPAPGTTEYRATGTTANGCSNTATALISTFGQNQTLPVELVHFDATWRRATPELTWRTASERNNAYFHVERSLDGERFEVAGRVTGTGTTLSETNYRFQDAALTRASAATVYYRLQQVDEDGRASYSPIRAVSVPVAARAATAAAYPNPYDQTVTVTFDALTAGHATVLLRDLLGQTVLRVTLPVAAGPQHLELPQAAALPAGVYYLLVQQGTQQQVLKLSHR
ncbi:T9SS type A sorting domain-containing protein [Hymenobacter sp. 15J16-1T3B]|uniref:Ig-like domain-containing protein n=1 Tax=Hymenobacter sp. 15J16-1T3B TaxID=2886941 RepID=UPI001D121FDC|nr:T9SS type A sorting domain-containing protein [Hymenobacter sp. 15J16-1T3B]MCC3159989.1 T9SS type A sorting domain-containing protein [Hymenobacter sp. 15J16-1T3B]